MGAVLLDLALILRQALRRLREKGPEPKPAVEDWQRVNVQRLVLWVLFWGAATVICGATVLHQPVKFLALGVGLCFLFVLINGIAMGVSDFNPISSAFVMSVFILAALGLHDPGVGLLCAAILGALQAQNTPLALLCPRSGTATRDLNPYFLIKD